VTFSQRKAERLSNNTDETQYTLSHKKKLFKSTTKNDGIAYHHHLTGHEIDFENTRILAEETSYWPRLIIEGLEIKKLQPTVRANMQAGYEIDPIWDIYLGSLKS